MKFNRYIIFFGVWFVFFGLFVKDVRAGLLDGIEPVTPCSVPAGCDGCVSDSVSNSTGSGCGGGGGGDQWGVAGTVWATLNGERVPVRGTDIRGSASSGVTVTKTTGPDGKYVWPEGNARGYTFRVWNVGGAQINIPGQGWTSYVGTANDFLPISCPPTNYGCENLVWGSSCGYPNQWYYYCETDSVPTNKQLDFLSTVEQQPTGDLSIQAKSALHSGVSCASLSSAAGLSGSGLTATVTGPENSGSYALDRLISNTSAGSYSVSVSGSAGVGYYTNNYVLCTDGVKTTGTSTNVSVGGGTNNVLVGAIERSSVYGKIFDASDVDTCALVDSLPGVAGSSVVMDGANNDYAVSAANGNYNQEVVSPDIYALNPAPGPGFVEEGDTPKLVCQISSANFSPNIGGGAQRADFGFWRQYGGWWRATGGDVYAKAGVASNIPNWLDAGDQWLIGTGEFGQDGVLWVNEESTIDLGSSPNAYISQSNWSAESKRNTTAYAYDFFRTKMSNLAKTDWDGFAKPGFAPAAGDDYQIYTHEGNVSMSFDVAAGEKMIFLIDGDVAVTGDINTEVGGTLTIIANGTISFASNVANAQGQFIADEIVVEDNDESDPQFRGEGSFTGWNSISLNRDRGETNNSEPAEEFVFRPDFVINAPSALHRSLVSWKEVAP